METGVCVSARKWEEGLTGCSHTCPKKESAIVCVCVFFLAIQIQKEGKQVRAQQGSSKAEKQAGRQGSKMTSLSLALDIFITFFVTVAVLNRYGKLRFVCALCVCVFFLSAAHG